MSATANPYLANQTTPRSTFEARNVRYFWGIRMPAMPNANTADAETRVVEADPELHANVVARLRTDGERVPWEEALQTRIQVG